MEKVLSCAPFDVAFGTILPDSRSTGSIYGRERLIEYVFASAVWKRAFNLMGVPNVTGCFAVYRTDVLKRIGFPHRTTTEDLDLCWTILEEKGSVVYVPEAIGYTREPQFFTEYSKQVKRWYSGYWQCLKVHGASRIGLSNKLTSVINVVLLDQLVLAPIWLAFLLGSLLPGLSNIPQISSLTGRVASDSFVSAFIRIWYRWFPFAANVGLALASLVFDVVVTATITAIWARKYHKGKQAVIGVPLFYLVSWYNRFVFWLSAVRTIVWKPFSKGSIW